MVWLSTVVVVVASDKLGLVRFIYWCSGETAQALDVAPLCPVDVCFYNESWKLDCHRIPVDSVRMRGKRSSPKERRVCGVCLWWLSENELADRIDHGSTGAMLPTGP